MEDMKQILAEAVGAAEAGHVVVGMAGPKHGGKSTFADHLVALAESSGLVVIRRAFADKLKWYYADMGWNGVKDDKGRRGLQLLGTEVGRECIAEHIWVYQWWREVGAALAGLPRYATAFVIADDVRFENEVEILHALGGHICEVYGRVPYTGEHHSEIPLPAHLIDHRFENVAGMETLSRAAAAFYYRLAAGKAVAV